MDKRLRHLNALHSFECAARHQSYSKAASEMFVSQAAISQQMRQLEQSLNTKLFVRNGRRMALTQNGETLYRACQSGFDTIVKGLNAIQCEGLPGELTITSTQAFCSIWIMPRLYKFSQLYPEINIKILGSNQVEDLTQKHIDLAIRFSPVDGLVAPKDMTIEEYGQDAIYPVCAPALVNNGCLNSPRDLLKCRLLYLANESRVTWQRWFTHLGVDDSGTLPVKTEVTSSDMALSAVLAGHGVALLATAMITPYLESGQLVVPFKVKHPVEWKRYLVFDPHSSKLARINAFRDWFRSELDITMQEAGAI